MLVEHKTSKISNNIWLIIMLKNTTYEHTYKEHINYQFINVLCKNNNKKFSYVITIMNKYFS